MELTKLDSYDYTLLPGCIQVTLDGTNDPSLFDIMSEIDRSNGNIYVDGNYFLMVGYDVYSEKTPNGRTYLNIQVTNTN